jgi:N-methylhydantoinase A
VVKAPLQKRTASGDLSAAATLARNVYHGKAHGWHESSVYDRDLLFAGATIEGPAVIEEMSSTTVIAPGQSARVDDYGNLIINLGQ